MKGAYAAFTPIAVGSLVFQGHGKADGHTESEVY